MHEVQLSARMSQVAQVELQAVAIPELLKNPVGTVKTHVLM